MYRTGPRRTPVVIKSAAVGALSLFAATVICGRTVAQELMLDEITVTARKRPEADKDVPLSVTSIDETQISDMAKTRSNADLARLAPNFSFVDLGGQSSNLANIRGVGSFSPVAPDDTSVVFYVDEAPQSVYGIAPNLLDTERVEVLRGPQGTLFGRNAQGGAINIVSRKPTFDPSFSLTTEIGSNGYRLGEMVANVPIIADTLAARAAIRYSRYGGDIPNVLTGGKDASTQLGAFRGTILYRPTEQTTVIVSGYYQKDDDTIPRFAPRNPTPISAVNPQNSVDRASTNLNLKIRHDFGSTIFESVSNFQRAYSHQISDLTDSILFSRVTGLPPSVFSVPGADLAQINLAETTYLQEFRLSSPEGSKVAWTTGVNFYRTEARLSGTTRAVVPAFATATGAKTNTFTTNSYAAFGEATTPIIGALKGTIGLRLTHEAKDAAYRYIGFGTPGTVPAYNQNLRLSDTFVTGRAALSYDWSKDIMTYASISRRYVTGGFPANSINNPIGKPEVPFAASTSITYETGFKSEWFERRFRLSGAVFLNDVKNGHLFVFDVPTASFNVTTLDYRSWGGEIEGAIRVVEDLEVFASVGATHSELVNVPIASPTGARNGNRVPNVAPLTANLGFQYQTSAAPVGLSGNFIARASYQFVGKRAADVANSFDLGAYSVVNGKLGWNGQTFETYVFANNLFDRRYEAFGQSFGPTVQSIRYGQGRIIGVGATVKF